MVSEFHFLRPWWLLALLPLAWFLIAFARRSDARRRWQGVIDAALMPHVLVGAGEQSRRRITAVLAIAGVLLLTALAGPVWQRAPQPVFRNLDALVIVLDLSASMDVEDLKPSRLARARFKIRDILEQRQDGQSALVAHAADAFVVSPLTDDAQTISALVPALTTALMPSQGSRADRGLEKASQLLQQAGATTGQILLITDGVNDARDVPTAARLAAGGYRVSVLGVGTSAGGPIPGPDGFVTRNGAIVIAKLDATALQAVAQAGGGLYRLISASDNDIESLLASMSSQPAATKDTGLQTDTWKEAGPWLLLPLLLLAPFAFRRGVLAVWLLTGMAPVLLPVQPAHAFELDDLWTRPDQRASRMLASGDPAAAAELFTDPAWKSAAAYRAGQFEDSLAALEGLTEIESTYNRGNALAQLGRYDEAVAAYEETLEQNAEHHDARYNLEQVKKLLQEQQANNDQSEDGEQNPDDSSSANDDANQNGASDNEANGDSGQDGSADNNSAERSSGESQESPSDTEGGNSDSNSANGQDNSTADERSDTPNLDEDAARDAMNNAIDKDAASAAERAGSAAAATDAEPGTDESVAGQTASAQDAPPDEDDQATEQWLRRIPDDPGGLLRRKFYYQYQRQPAAAPEEQPW